MRTTTVEAGIEWPWRDSVVLRDTDVFNNPPTDTEVESFVVWTSLDSTKFKNLQGQTYFSDLPSNHPRPTNYDAVISQIRGTKISSPSAVTMNIGVPANILNKWEPSINYTKMMPCQSPERAIDLQPYNVTKEQFGINRTPAKAFVDLHSDRGMTGVAVAIKCRKIWLFYPPIPHNRTRFMDEMSNQHRSGTNTESAKETLLERCDRHLEGRVVIHQSARDVVIVPDGWFHAVFTLQAGFLLGTDVLLPGLSNIERAINALHDEWQIAANNKNPKFCEDSFGLLSKVIQQLMTTYPTSSKDVPPPQIILDGLKEIIELEESFGRKIKRVFAQARKWVDAWSHPRPDKRQRVSKHDAPL